MLLIAETSAVSACAIIGLLSYIAVCVSDAPHQLEDDSSTELCFQKYSAVTIKRGSSRRWSFGGPAEVYFLNQLAWDLVQATGELYDSGDWLCSLTKIVPPGGLMDIKWSMDGVRIVSLGIDLIPHLVMAY